MLIRGCLVYENDGRILKCGHELCAGELGLWSNLSIALLKLAWVRLLGRHEPVGDCPRRDLRLW